MSPNSLHSLIHPSHTHWRRVLYTTPMDNELSPEHRQVLSLEKLRRKRGYKEGWLYHLCLEKGLLPQLEELQLAGLVGNNANSNLTESENESDRIGAPGSPRTMLTVELVPRTSWFTNLRSELSKSDWDSLRHTIYERADYRCEICGQKGSKHPVECHEIWEYDDKNRVQRLAGLLALCPACHEAKHIGYASSIGRGSQARVHLARVNNWSMEDVDLYLEVQFEQWSRRSQHEWKLDLSWLHQFDIYLD